MTRKTRKPVHTPPTPRELAQRRYSESLDVVEAYKIQLNRRQAHARNYDTPFYWDRVREAQAQLEAAEAKLALDWMELDYLTKERTAALGTLHG